jgi:hypothetical protein
MSTRRSRPLLLLLVLICMGVTMLATGTGSLAAKSGVILKRNAKELNPRASHTQFGSPTADDSCSGWCSCSLCGCSGGDSCCDAGCDACWAYRDGQGLCGGAQ